MSGVRTIRRRRRRTGADLSQEQLGTEAPRVEELLAHGREADVLGDLDVVVAHDRQVVGHAQAKLVGGADDAQRLRVAGGEDRGRAVVAEQQARRELPSLVAAVGAERHEVRPRGRPGSLERLLVPDVPVAAGGEAERVVELVADERDLPVAEAEQMGRRGQPAGDVIADHVREPLDRRRVGVHDDDRDRGRREPANVLLARREGDDEQPVGVLGERASTESVVPLLDGLDVVDDEIELAIAQDGLDAAKSLGGLGSCEEGGDDADRERPTHAEATGGAARCVVKLRDRVQDPLALLRIHRDALVHDARRGRLAHAGPDRDIVERVARHPPSAMKPVS